MLFPAEVAFRLDAELLHTEVGLAVTEVGIAGNTVTVPATAMLFVVAPVEVSVIFPDKLPLA